MNNATIVRAAALALGVWATAAAAQGKEPERVSPWSVGVSDADRAKAMELFRQGNLLLKDSVFVKAAASYREALKHWDHPAIHYNLVLALLNLDQPIEVHQHLESAMKYGPDPLDQDKFEQARAYKILIEKQLAKVTVTCDVEGASVVMDGRPLFVAPGRYEGLVRAGPHTVVATREGYLTNEISRSLPPGESTVIELSMFTDSDLTRYRRRWSAWMPWSVLAGGAAVAVTGGVLHMGARNSFTSYDAAIADCGGCVPSSAVSGQLRMGHTQQTLAMASYALGGAGLIAGATLVYMNRLESYRVSPQDLQVQPVTVLPIIGKDEGGIFASVRF